MTKTTATKRSTKRAAAANAVDHKAFFPILAQAAGEDRGKAFKTNATVETAAPIVAALAKSLAKLGGLKARDILEAAAGGGFREATTKPVAPAKRADAKPAAKTPRAKAPVYAAGDKVLAKDDERNGRFFRATIVRLLKNDRVKVAFPDGFETIVDLKDGIQPRAKRGA